MYLETKRLMICKFNEDMVESVHVNSLDEDNRRFVPDEVFESIEEAKGTIEFLMAQYDGTSGPYVYPILLHNGENIGHIQAIEIDGGWEIGYHIAKAHTNKGYSTEAVKAFIPSIFEKLNITSIYGICLEDNVASQKVLEKSGFVLKFKGMRLYQNEERMILKYIYS